METKVFPQYILYALCILLFCCGFAAAQSEEPSKNFFKRLDEAGFTLQRALSGPDKGEAAAFSFLSTLGDKTVFAADFALSWHPPREPLKVGPFDLTFLTSVEGKFTSAESESENAWRFRASLIGDTSQIGPIDSTYNAFSFKYESDQDFDTQKFMAETVFTPTVRKLALGKAWPSAPTDPSSGQVKQYPPFQFLWRPFLGLDVGHTLDKGLSAETEETILRIQVRGRAQLLLNLITQLLGLYETSIFVDNTFYYLPLEGRKGTHNFLVAGIEFLVTEKVSIGLTYKIGEEAPIFKEITTFGGTIGIRF
jgi:hypothetical protein